MSENQVDLIDRLFPERAKYKGLGPADCAFKVEERPVTFINFSRPTNHDGESLQINIPVFATDSQEDVLKRFHILTAIGDLRFRENNRALQISKEIHDEEVKKAELAKVEQQAIKRAIKKGILKPVDNEG